MLKIGMKAPSFILTNQNNEQIEFPIKDKICILFFYPKDNTPGCTLEACNINDNIDYFENNDIAVFGLSTNTVDSHLKFANKFNFKYSLLADVDKEVVQLYNVWGKKKFMGREYEGTFRQTFIVDKNGFISYIIEKVNTKTAGDDLKEIINKNKTQWT